MFKRILIATAARGLRVINCPPDGYRTVAVYFLGPPGMRSMSKWPTSGADRARRPAAESYSGDGKRSSRPCRKTAPRGPPAHGVRSSASLSARAGPGRDRLHRPNPGANAAMGDQNRFQEGRREADVSTGPALLALITDGKARGEIADGIVYPVHDKSLRGRRRQGDAMAHFDLGSRRKAVVLQAEAKRRFLRPTGFHRETSADPRHTEIFRVLGDKQGNVLYLGEPRMFVRARYQKVTRKRRRPLARRTTPQDGRTGGSHSAKALNYVPPARSNLSGADKSFFFSWR